jgi:hypothetical protein
MEQPRTQVFKTIHASCDKDHMRQASLGKLERKFLAESGGGAGDKGRLTGEGGRHSSI